MTTAQGAEYLGISPRRCRELVAQGSIPSTLEQTPRGPVYWLKRTDLDRFREERARENEARKGKRGRPLKGAGDSSPS